MHSTLGQDVETRRPMQAFICLPPLLKVNFRIREGAQALLICSQMAVEACVVGDCNRSPDLQPLFPPLSTHQHHHFAATTIINILCQPATNLSLS